MFLPATVPPQLVALTATAQGPLSPVTVRLCAADLAALEALRERLNKPSRAALLRYVMSAGLQATSAQLDGLVLQCSPSEQQSAHQQEAAA